MKTSLRLWEKENGYLDRFERDKVFCKVEKLLHDMESKAVTGLPCGKLSQGWECLSN